MVWHCSGQLELEHGAVCCGCYNTDGCVGQEEGVEIQKGLRGKIPEEAILYAAPDLVKRKEIYTAWAMNLNVKDLTT